MGRKKTTVVISNWKGIPTVRSKPAKVKQTYNTVNAGNLFGMAANRAAIVRKLLKPILPEAANRTVIYRLQLAFYQWLRAGALHENNPVENISFFNGLSFNEKNTLIQFLGFPVTVGKLADGSLLVSLPPFDPVKQIKSPEGATAVDICVGVVSVEVNNPATQSFWQTALTIQNVQGLLPRQQITLPVVVGSGTLLIVMVALKYIPGIRSHHLGLPWKPAGIVGSFYN